MKTNVLTTLAIATTLALTGCTSPTWGLPGQRPNTLTTPAAQGSLPFKTVLDDGSGSGRYRFQAGASERVVLDDKAALEAFLQRHARTAPEGNPSNPNPPMDPLPETLANVDFGKYQLVAFFDGQVKLGATSRITAVRLQGDGLVVDTMRWEPPANPASADDPIGRVHIIALPRANKAMTFSELAISNETSKTGGGTAVAGNPVMQPRWPAVPNPEVTQAMIEQGARAQFSGAGVTRLTVEKHTVQWLTTNLGPDYGLGLPYTDDSEVWVVIAEGDLPFNGPGGAMAGTIGAAEPRASKVVQLLSIEDGMMWHSATTPVQTDPGMRFELVPNGTAFVGDLLHFDVTGKQSVDGTLKMTLQVGDQGQPLVKEIAYKDLATFKLPLDKAAIPALADAPVQRLTVKLEYGNAGQSSTIDLVRDRDAHPTPPMRAVGPTDNPNTYGPSAGEAALEAFARDMASADWKGQNLSLTSQVVSRAELNLPSPQWDSMPTTVGLRKFTVRGQFPKYLLPDVVTPSGKPEVFAPKRLEIVLSDSAPIHVVSTKAFAD